MDAISLNTSSLLNVLLQRKVIAVGYQQVGDQFELNEDFSWMAHISCRGSVYKAHVKLHFWYRTRIEEDVFMLKLKLSL